MFDTRATLNEISELIAPYVSQFADREALFGLALIDHPNVYSEIDFRGNSHVFTVRSIGTLLDIEVSANTSALTLVLDQLKRSLDESKHSQVDNLIIQVNRVFVERRRFHSQINARPDIASSTQETVSPAPRITLQEQLSQLFKLLLRILGITVGIIALVLGFMWYLDPNVVTFEPLIFLLGVIGGALYNSGVITQSLQVGHPKKAPAWLRIALGTIGTLLTIIGFAIAILWVQYPAGGYEPLTFLFLTTGPVLISAANRSDLGLHWLTWRRLSPEERIMYFLDELEQGWIEGFLRAALRDVQEFSIKWSGTRDLTVSTNEYGDVSLDNAANIINVFDQLRGNLIILGHPGAGKTIVLLQLAEALMGRARELLFVPSADRKRVLEIPLVFNLSDWARSATPTPLYNWVITEATQSYKVQEAWVKRWLEDFHAVLLLDGLDEISEDFRGSYIAAINSFRLEHPNIKIVVSSRIDEFKYLSTSMELNGAIVLRELDSDTVDGILASGGRDLDGLRRLVANDPIVREMVTTPFLLNTMLYTYAFQSIATLKLPPSDAGPIARRNDLFNAYVNRRLESVDNLSKRRVREFLTYLATHMKAEADTSFRSNNINGDWLRVDPRLHKMHQLTLRVLAGSSVIGFSFVIGLMSNGVLSALFLSGWALFSVAFYFYWAGDAIIDRVTTTRLPKYASLLHITKLKISRLPALHFLLLVINTLLCLLAAMSISVLLIEWDIWLTAAMVVALNIVVEGMFWLVSRFADLLSEDEVYGMSTVFKFASIISLSSAVILPTHWLSGIGASISFAFLLCLVNSIGSPHLGIDAYSQRTGQRIARFSLLTCLITGAGATMISNNFLWIWIGILLGIIVWLPFEGLLILDRLIANGIVRIQGRLPRRVEIFLGTLAQAQILRRRSGGYQFIHRYLLESFAEDDDVKMLVASLNDSVRSEGALTRLVQLEERAVESLIDALIETNQTTHTQIVRALSGIGRPSVDALVGALAENRTSVQLASVEALVQIGSPAVAPLIGALTHNNAYTRQLAADALGRIGDSAALEPLTNSLKDEVASVREAAILSLGRIGSNKAMKHIVAALYSSDEKVQSAAATALVYIGASAIEPLLMLLNQKDRRVRLLAIAALGEIGTIQIVNPLVSLLDDTDFEIRRNVAVALGQVRTPIVVEPLVALLCDRHTEVQRQAVESLTNIGPHIAERVLALLTTDNNRSIRVAAIEVLGHTSSNVALEALLALLEDPDTHVKGMAIWALGEIGDERAVRPLSLILEQLLSSPQDKESIMIVRAIKSAIKKITESIESL
ncbi:MAG: hypothetical protein CL610_06310 [Anaerolineaceae bacterium]|nr:hypothetical protein [Anaerolineaceae bacterium]